jgi:hypothetical protein
MNSISTLEGVALGVRLLIINDQILETIKHEPLLIYYASGESNYVAWKVILANGQRKLELEQWMVSAPWMELQNAINRVAVAAGDQPNLNFGSLRIYAKYPYTTHNCKKIQLFVPKPKEGKVETQGTHSSQSGQST